MTQKENIMKIAYAIEGAMYCLAAKRLGLKGKWSRIEEVDASGNPRRRIAQGERVFKLTEAENEVCNVAETVAEEASGIEEVITAAFSRFSNDMLK